jgi:hypothetical protein
MEREPKRHLTQFGRGMVSAPGSGVKGVFNLIVHYPGTTSHGLQGGEARHRKPRNCRGLRRIASLYKWSGGRYGTRTYLKIIGKYATF